MLGPYHALLFVSFGGPEGPDDVIPFLENVLRGKPVPRERMLEVAEHYQHFGGVSPINEQNRKLIAIVKLIQNIFCSIFVSFLVCFGFISIFFHYST